MIQYKVIKSQYFDRYVGDGDVESFNKEITKYLNNGWNLVGGVATNATEGNCHCLLQALIKET